MCERGKEVPFSLANTAEAKELCNVELETTDLLVVRDTLEAPDADARTGRGQPAEEPSMVYADRVPVTLQLPVVSASRCVLCNNNTHRGRLEALVEVGAQRYDRPREHDLQHASHMVQYGNLTLMS